MPAQVPQPGAVRSQFGSELLPLCLTSRPPTFARAILHNAANSCVLSGDFLFDALLDRRDRDGLVRHDPHPLRSPSDLPPSEIPSPDSSREFPRAPAPP